MHNSIAVIGMGEMAGVFSRAFLKAGYSVVPILRNMNMDEAAQQNPTPEMVLLSVAEKDLHSTLEQIPHAWRTKLALLQNELLPRDWTSHKLTSPTVISVWFEKKKGQDYKVLVPSPVFGTHANLITHALSTLDIPCQVLDKEEQLVFELVRKNVYILTTNICGLVVGGSVETLWNQHRDLATEVANEVIDIQDYLTGTSNNRQALIEGMVTAINGDLEHKCMGRSAPARLSNALTIADEAKLAVPKLREIMLQTVEKA